MIRPDTGTEEERNAVREILNTVDVLALADVDAELARLAESYVVVPGAEGEEVVLATQACSNDWLHYYAATGAIYNAIWDQLEGRGVLDPTRWSSLSFAAQSDCVNEIK